MTEKQMWEAYTREHPDKWDVDYEAWCYGSDIPDVLAEIGEIFSENMLVVCEEFEMVFTA